MGHQNGNVSRDGQKASARSQGDQVQDNDESCLPSPREAMEKDKKGWGILASDSRKCNGMIKIRSWNFIIK